MVSSRPRLNQSCDAYHVRGDHSLRKIAINIQSIQLLALNLESTRFNIKIV